MTRKWAMLLSGVMLIALLAACSGGGGGNGGASDGGSSGGGATGDGQDGDAVRLTVLMDGAMILTNFKQPQEAYDRLQNDIDTGKVRDDAESAMKKANLELMVAKMAEKNIAFESPDWGWAEPLIQKQTAAFMARTGPDVIVGETQSPGFALQGQLEPFPDALASYVRDNVMEAAWKPMELDGKIYGVAVQPGVNVLWWNKQVLQDAGLDPERVPASWEELIDNARQITEAGQATGGGVYAGPNFGGYLRFGAFLKLAGGFYTDEAGSPSINAPANLAAFEFLRAMEEANKPGILSAKDEGTFFGQFEKGQMGYVVDGPWRGGISQSLGIDVGVAPLPLGPAGEPANVTIGAAFMSVPTYSKNKDAAFAFIEAMFSEEIQQNIADAGVRAPVLKSIASSDAYKEAQPVLFEFAKGLEGDVAGLPTFVNDSTKAWEAIGEAMSKTMLTDDPIQDIADAAQKKLEDIVQ